MRALRLAIIGTFGLLGLASGTAQAAQKITVTPASPINMGAPPVNQTNTVMVTISNTGDMNLSVTQITMPVSPFRIDPQTIPGLPISLPQGASFPIAVQFTPTAQGSFNSSFVITSNDPNTPNLTMQLSGSAGNPMITLDSATIIFPATRVGGSSGDFPYKPNVINISDTGLGDLKVTGLLMGGANPNDFKVFMPPQLPVTINPGKSFPIQVIFTPTALGGRNGTLTIQNSDGNAPNKQVTLIGTATQAMLTASTNALDFGTQQEFIASNPKPITITNAGNGDAYVKAVTFTGNQPGSFALSAPPTFPAKVAANNGTLALNVVGVPLMGGKNDAVMHVQYDDPMKAEDAISVVVMGVAGSVSLNNPYVDFGPVSINPNPPPTRMVTITNKGTNDLLITNAIIDDPMMANAFDSMKVNMLQNNMGFPVTIKPNATYSFDVIFQPQVPMQFTASLNLDFDGDPMAKHVHVPLAGIGTMAGLTVSPMNMALAFPATKVGAFSIPQTVTLTNTGGTTIDVQSVTLGGASPQAFQIDQMGAFKIDPGKTVAINVTFQPLTGGAAMAVMTITITGLTPVNIKLTGTGSTIMLGVAPMSIDFGMVTVGTPSDPAVIGMKNGGTFDLKLTSITSTDPAFTVNTATTAMTLKQGQTTTFQVTAIPPTATMKSAVVNISVEGTTFMVPVSVTGIPPVKRMAPGGCSVTNAGSSQLPIALVLLLGGLAAAVAVPRVRRALRRR